MTVTKAKELIGRVEQVSFPGLFPIAFHARIDTGAKKSTIWVSRAEYVDGQLRVTFFDKGASGYTGKVVVFHQFGQTVIASSNGHKQNRFTIKLPVMVHNRRIKATFTLADRSTQVYPILIGRNILRGKFIVDVELGNPVREKERQRTIELRKNLKKQEVL